MYSRFSISLLFSILFLFQYNAFPQQNFFNVPSNDITLKNKIFVQEQVNINQIFQSNFTFDVGLGKGWHTGANIIGVDFYNTKYSFAENEKGDKDIFEPLFLLNIQKAWQLRSEFNFSFGSNQGLNIDFLNGKAHYAQFDFGLLGNNIWKHAICATYGLYFGNAGYFQNSESIGFMAGLDASLIRNKLHLVFDYISGRTPASVSVLGISYFLNPYFPISLGWQIPNISQNSSALVVEFTWNPSLRE